MGTEVQKFEDRVKDRIKEIIADLIPEDQWKEIVDQTINNFKHNDLPKLVREELNVFCKKELQKILDSPEFATKWSLNNSGKTVSDEIMKMMIDSAPLMFATIMQNIAAHTIQQMRSNLSTYG